MQGRVAAGIGAWVIGVVSATSLSLVAVSVFGRDAANSHGPVLSQDDVARALASATADPSPGTGPSTSASTTKADPAGTAPPPTPSQVAPTTSAPPAPSTTSIAPVSRVLSSPAGTVVVRCQGSQVYLRSWSPAQGFQVAGIQRGPGRVAAVDFVGPHGQIVQRFYCSGGVPVSGGDDGPWDH